MFWIYREILEVGKLLFEEGLVSARAGNLSRAFGEKLFITRTGSFTGKLSPEDVIVVPLKGSSIIDHRASVELLVHREIILRTGKKAVVHAHPPSGVALSFTREVIKPEDSEGREVLGIVRVLEVRKPSASEELAKAVSETLKDSKVVLVRGHGAFAADRDLFKAYSYISTLEHSCKILMWR